MGKIIKWFVRSVLTTITLVVLGIIYLVVVVDPNDYKPEIKGLAANQGVELSLDGDLAWQFFPQIGIKVQRVEFAYGGYASGNIGQLTLAINWLDLLKLSQADQQLPLGTVKIADSSIRIEPIAPNEIPLQLDAVDAVIRNFSLQGERFPLTFSAQALGAIDIVLNTDVALQVADNQLQKVALEDITLAIDQLEVEGRLVTDGGFSLGQGNLQSNSINLKQLLNDLQKTFPLIQVPKMAFEEALTAVSFNSTFSFDTKGISNITSQLSIDNQLLFVDSEINHSIQNLRLSVSGDGFDMANYLATESAAADQNNALFAPLAVPFALWLGQSQMEVSLGALTFDDFAVKNIYINLFGNQKVLQLSSFNADIFEGQINATGRLDMRSTVPVFELHPSLANIDLQLALPALADSSDLSGLLSAEVRLEGSGNSHEEIITALSGQGELTVLSPSYLAINAEETFCNAAAMFGGSSSDRSWSKGTQLETLSSQFSLDNGKVLIENLKTATGNLSINGRGTVQLLPKRYSFTANTRVTGTTTSASGCSVNKSLQNRNLPFICTGSFDVDGKTSCKPADSLVRDFLKGSVFKKLGGQLFDTPVTRDTGSGIDRDSDSQEQQPEADPLKSFLRDALEKKLK